MTPAQSWAHAVERRAENDPDGDLIRRVGGTRATAGQILERSVRLAGALSTVAAAGDVVATAVPTGPEAAALSTAISWIGAVELPVPVGVDPEVVTDLARRVRCQIVVADPARLDSAPHLATFVSSPKRLVTTRDHLPSMPSLDQLEGPAPRRHRLAVTDPAAVMLSSGTGGRPRGALLPVGVGLGQAARVGRAMAYDRSDTLLNVFAWEHVNARHAGFLPAVLSGACLVVDDFSASRFWRTAEQERVTAFNFMGALCAILLRTPESPGDRIHQVDRAYGGPAPDWLWHAFLERFGVTLRQAYACTELGDVATTGSECLPGAAGQVVPEYEVRVVDDEGRTLPSGSTGRLLVKPTAPGMAFTEYVGDPDATSATMQRGWFRTGDRGRVIDGWLFHDGREGDVIRRRGLTIDAQYVERVAADAEGVAEAAVVGLPSDLTDDDVLLVVVPEPDAKVDARAVHAFCEAHLPRHAVPRYVSVEETLPRTTTYKVIRQALRDRGVPLTAWDSDHRQVTTKASPPR